MYFVNAALVRKVSFWEIHLLLYIPVLMIRILAYLLTKDQAITSSENLKGFRRLMEKVNIIPVVDNPVMSSILYKFRS